MKRLSEQTHYEVLDIDTGVSKRDIEIAYKLAKKTFGEDSVATYSLFESEEKKAILKRIEDAYRVLIDEKKRDEYDDELERRGYRIDRKREKAIYGTGTSAQGAREISGLGIQAERPSIDMKEILNNINNEFTGKNLRRIRKKLNITLQEIADRTRINITYLRFIEDDYYKELPYEVYLKGYLSQYLKYMGIDPKDVVEGYLRFYREYWDNSKKNGR